MTPSSRSSHFVNYSYDYRLNWTPIGPLTIVNRCPTVAIKCTHECSNPKVVGSNPIHSLNFFIHEVLLSCCVMAAFASIIMSTFNCCCWTFTITGFLISSNSKRFELKKTISRLVFLRFLLQHQSFGKLSSLN